MGLFDMDYGDPSTMALLGTIAGLGNASMPSRLPVPLGAVFGKAAEGMAQGAAQGQSYRTGQAELAGKTLGNVSALQRYNLIAPYLGGNQMTMQDLYKGNFGGSAPLGAPPQATAAGMSATSMPPVSASIGSAPASGAGGGTPSIASSGGAPLGAPGGNDKMKQLMVMQALGMKLTPLQEAQFAESMTAPGTPEANLAHIATIKAAGIDPYPNVRAGGELPSYDAATGTYKPGFRNPNLPQGMVPDDDGQGAHFLNNVLSGISAETTAKAVPEQNAILGREKAIEQFKNFLEFGDQGMGAPAATVTPPAGYPQQVASLESGGNPTARPPINPATGKPASSALGTGQFIDGTWLDVAKKHLPADAIKGMSDDQLLSLRTNPEVSNFLTQSYAQDNAAALGSAGVKNLTAPDLYMAHRFGPDGAAKIIQAPANTPVEQVVSPQVLQANPELAGHTTGEVYAALRGKMAAAAPRTAQQAPAAAPQQAAPPPPSPARDPNAEAPGVPQGGYGLYDDKGGLIGYVGPDGKKVDVPPNTLPTQHGTFIPNVDQQPPMNKGSAYLKERVKQFADTENDWNKVQQSSYVAEQRALAIGDALKKVESGHFTEDKADINASLKALGLPEIFATDPAEVQKVLKNSFTAVLEQIKQFSSRPAAAEVTLGLKNYANPNLQPGANLSIISETIGQLRWERSLLNDWGQAKKMGWVDPQAFAVEWRKANPIQAFVDQSKDEIGPLKGMPGGPGSAQEKQSAAPQLPPGVTAADIQAEIARRAAARQGAQ